VDEGDDETEQELQAAGLELRENRWHLVQQAWFCMKNFNPQKKGGSIGAGHGFESGRVVAPANAKTKLSNSAENLVICRKRHLETNSAPITDFRGNRFLSAK